MKEIVLPAEWAIMPDALDAISVQGFAGEHSEARTVMRMDGDIAVISMRGVLTKESLFITYGAATCGMRGIAETVAMCANDDSVKAILLDIDSPGGTVDGVEELASAIASANGKKAVYAYADGLMASAAYWAGSQARKIAAPASARVGSIGVILAHKDFSGALERAGIKISYLTAGKYKAMGNDAEPLSEEARAYLQEGLDGIYGMFLDAVARGRGFGAEDVRHNMADGKIYNGREALRLGLIDAVMSKAEFLAEIKKGVNGMEEKIQPAAKNAVQEKTKEPYCNAEDAAALQEGARSAGIKAACDMASMLFGEDAGKRLASLMASGISAEQFAAVREAIGAEIARPNPPKPCKAEETLPKENAEDAGKQILAALQEATPKAISGTGEGVRGGSKDNRWGAALIEAASRFGNQQ